MYEITRTDGSPQDRKSTSYTARMAGTFRRPDQNVKTFGEEIKALSNDDRAWFVAEFNRAGYVTESAPLLA